VDGNSDTAWSRAIHSKNVSKRLVTKITLLLKGMDVAIDVIVVNVAIAVTIVDLLNVPDSIYYF
jgi:hypothetical protein